MLTIEHIHNERCEFCGRFAHTLAVNPASVGRAESVCVAVPTDEHPVPAGAVEYRDENGERAFVVAERHPAEIQDYVGAWHYHTPSGWPLEREEVPASARAAARALASC